MADDSLSSSLTLKDQALWFGKIELRGDKIRISGWTWTGPVEETIPIRNVATFETWMGRADTNFRLSIDGEDPIRGYIKQGLGLWEAKMETDERVELRRRF